MREALKRLRWRHGIIGAALLIGGSHWAEPAVALNVVVNSTADSGAGSLRDAITQINGAGAGTHSITFSVSANSTITLATGLPFIQNSVTIDGSGASNLTVDGNSANRIFFVDSGTVEIRDLRLANGLGRGGDSSPGAPQNEGGGGGGGLGAGGAVFVNAGANVTVRNVTLATNTAQGGNGGSSTGGFNLYDAGGGGGGFMGDGGRGGYEGGGGGGGFDGNGGSANNTVSSLAGAGGGGLTANGSNAVNNAPGAGGGEGGAGGASGAAGTAGSANGGGGGGGSGANGGAGGDFGGGGGGGYGTSGGNAGGAGGFGGGGGGAGGGFGTSAGQGGFGGGNGGNALNGGEGGDGLGGAVFVRQGGTLTIIDSNVSGGTVTGGTAGSGGSAASGGAEGSGFYVMTGISAIMQYSQAISIADTIGGAGGITKNGAATLTFTGTENTYTGLTTVNTGILALGKTPASGNYGASIKGHLTIGANGTVRIDADNQINDTSTVTANGGTLALGSQGDTVNHLILNSGAQVTGTSGGVGLGFNSASGVATTGTSAVTISSRISLQSGAPADTLAREFNVGADAPLTVSGQIYNGFSGVASVRKTGAGTLIYTGTNTYTGGTTVEDGRLIINGSQAGNVVIETAGELGGSGSIGGNLTSDGRITPGNSIGTLTVGGNFTHSMNNSIEIELNGAGASDLIAATGTATIDCGIVDVVAAPGAYTVGTHYTIITAAGGVVVTNPFTAITDDLADYHFEAIYNAHNIQLLLLANTTVLDFAQTPNQLAVAEFLTAVAPGGGAGGTVFNAINALGTGNAPQALDQLGGHLYASAPLVNLQGTTHQVQMVVGQLRPTFGAVPTYNYENEVAQTAARNVDSLIRQVSYDESTVVADGGSSGGCGCRRFDAWGYSRNAWMTGYGLGGAARSDGNASGLNYSVGGALFGIELGADDSRSAGIYGGYAESNVNLTSVRQSADIQGGQFGLYGRWECECDYTLALAGLGFDTYDSERILQVGGIGATSRGDYDGWQGVAYLERGRTYSFDDAGVQPYVAVQYIYLRQNSFTETNGGLLGLDVEGVDINSLRSLLGARFQREIGVASGCGLTGELRASWMHEFLDSSATVAAGLVGVGGTTFAVEGLDLGRDWAIVGGGLRWNLSDRWTLAANYDAQTNTQQTFHIGSGSAQYTW